MKNIRTLKLFLVLAVLFLSALSSIASAQFTIPPDTTTYWMMNESGVIRQMHRPPDSTITKGILIIRFRQNALNYGKLLNTYEEFYDTRVHHGKGGSPLSGPIPNDTNRGFPQALQESLRKERFYIDSSSNIILDTSLKNF